MRLLDEIRGAQTTWKDGEVRATHRPKATPRRDWRTRKDPLEAVIVDLRAWFDEQPDRNAKELLERLKREHPEVVGDGQMRTLQRRLKNWRKEEARRLVFTPQEQTDVGFGANSEVQAGNIPC